MMPAGTASPCLGVSIDVHAIQTETAEHMSVFAIFAIHTKCNSHTRRCSAHQVHNKTMETLHLKFKFNHKMLALAALTLTAAALYQPVMALARHSVVTVTKMSKLPVVRPARVTPWQAMHNAERATGGHALQATYAAEGGRWSYDVILVHGNRLSEVEVNASTGKADAPESVTPAGEGKELTDDLTTAVGGHVSASPNTQD